jgi:hypothetical protein
VGRRDVNAGRALDLLKPLNNLTILVTLKTRVGFSEVTGPVE